MIAASDLTCQLAHIVPHTEAEGPGRRFAIWLQGCALHCPGCCNPELFDVAGGRRVSVASILDELDRSCAVEPVEGITLLGGEPLAQAASAAELARGAYQRGLSVMLFSGYTRAEIEAMTDPAARELLGATDLLVDGRYDATRPDRERRWVGSTNQQVHFLTDRYRADDPCWRAANTLEIRLADGVLNVNGFPAAPAAPLWRLMRPRERDWQYDD